MANDITFNLFFNANFKDPDVPRSLFDIILKVAQFSETKTGMTASSNVILDLK